MRSWFARHPISFMALYTVFYLTAFHWLEVNITVPAIWVHCQLDDVIPFCKYAIVPYLHGSRGYPLPCSICCGTASAATSGGSACASSPA